jgi:hypothetical protein
MTKEQVNRLEEILKAKDLNIDTFIEDLKITLDDNETNVYFGCKPYI